MRKMHIELCKYWSMAQMGFENQINWNESKQVVAILERNGKFAAGLFTKAGLYSTSLPRNTAEDAIKAVGGSGLELSTLK
ncbi:MAG: hypothetical protein ACTSV9_04290, partial [Candidatus Thorarchaeota archaeon]